MFRILIYASLLTLACPPVSLRGQASSSSARELRIIVVDTPALADRVLQRLKKGEDFGTVAEEVSIDPTASDGGYMGRIDPSTLRSELRDALAGLTPGDMTGVIHTHSGYAILKVLSPTETAPLQNTAPARLLPSAATGAVRYAPNVGGKGEADLAYRNFSKPDGWNKNLRVLCDIRQKSLASGVEPLLKGLYPANSDG